MKKILFLLSAAVSLWNCSPKEFSAILLEETEYRDLDTLVVSAARPAPSDGTAQAADLTPPAPYQASARRHADLLHTRLDVRFDWQKEQVLGKAVLTIQPYFQPIDQIVLDAKGFLLHRVALAGQPDTLPYFYDGEKLTVRLDKSYPRGTSFDIDIDYTATPLASGGSDAITSDKGLFFINPTGSEPGKPRQIWTQGETENNSRWFPTIDKPNERATHDILITVEKGFKTLSNGLLVESRENPDGTRTDHWNMSLPHAPYLVMIAVGDFTVVRDTWNGIPVEYFMEPRYEPYARDIFPHTPDMLQLFSDLLDVPYPWQKYAQVVVRDYVSGAMENTTAVIFGEFMNGTDRELVDNLQNEKIIAHEMFHHWFGDLVTCESWANLTLNEGFANYSEYLWLEHKYGRAEADFHRLQELSGYLESANTQGIHPLIHFGYDEKEDMFDAHSYNKGGLVLHMLREYVGEEAFFAALGKYLRDNAFTDVEAHELRLAFEEVTGEDLNWFFNQWYFREGHPVLDVDYDYDEVNRQVILTVEQTQDPTRMPAVFELPVKVAFQSGTDVITHSLRINQRSQTFLLDAEIDPDLILFDVPGVLLAEINEAKSQTEYAFQFRNAGGFLHRLKAFQAIMDGNDDARRTEAVDLALADDFWLYRLLALEQVSLDRPDRIRQVADMMENDPHSAVRQLAVQQIASLEELSYAARLVAIIRQDPSAKVADAALIALHSLDESVALDIADKRRADDSESNILTLSSLYANTENPLYLTYFEEKFDKIHGYARYEFLQHYTSLATHGGVADISRAGQRLKSIAMDSHMPFWMRYQATRGINELHAVLQYRTASASGEARSMLLQNDKELLGFLADIKLWETDERLRNAYQGFPNPATEP
jgi:aminopeptidase N